MSLFPAYGESGQNKKQIVVDSRSHQFAAATDDTTNNERIWQNNTSYQLPAILDTSSNFGLVTESDSDFDVSSRQNRSLSPDTSPPDRSQFTLVLKSLEFDNSVERFYVDKKPNKSYLEFDCLPRLPLPKYKLNQLCLADNDRRQTPNDRHRYGKFSRTNTKSLRHFKLAAPGARLKLPEKEITQRIGALKLLVSEQPFQLSNWIELHHLLSHNLTKSNRLAVAEHQLRLLENALQQLPGNEDLLRLYVATLSSTYPDSEVSTKIDQLLERHPFEYTLWTALIMTTQGTMTRCNVPDVLNIYEQCMRRMNLRQKDTVRDMNVDIHMYLDTDRNMDDLMLKLFHNCVLFLRQSGNYDRMFALLKLALELNTEDLSFNCLEARAAVERPLVEYEELVLRSGMPMPEIWTRIERLRQAFNFLPYPQLRGTTKQEEEEAASNSGLDLQRFIYTEEVCRYIYPLKSKKSKCKLLLLALQLTKFPFVRTNSLADRLSTRIDQIGDSESAEMLLASLGDRYSYIMPPNRCNHYAVAMLQLAKELSVSPTFMPHFIGSELYEHCISKLLLKCSEAFNAPYDETKRRIFIILWFRFERLRLLLLILSDKLTDAYVRDARRRQRQLLQLEANRQVTRFYTELGMFEYEVQAGVTDERDKNEFRVFEKILAMPPNLNDVELLHANLIYAEMLFAREQYAQSKHILSCLVVQKSSNVTTASLEFMNVVQESHQLVTDALKAANEDASVATHAMPLEDYFMSNRLILLLRVHCMLLCLNGRSVDIFELLANMMDQGIFARTQLETTTTMDTTRYRFMREQFRELQLVMLQLPSQFFIAPCDGVGVGHKRKELVWLVEQSLLEFPRNLTMLQTWSTLGSLPWYKQRGHLVRIKAGILALLNVVIAARCRVIHQNQTKSNISAPNDELFGKKHLQQQQGHLENLVRNRVLSVIETFLPTNPHRSQEEAEQYAVLRRNSLYWRCYLRCLSNERTSFERSKSCLLMALDECPWDKAIYMDGVTYAPQEVANLQDVMTEKQLRIYAITEELNMLRGT